MPIEQQFLCAIAGLLMRRQFRCVEPEGRSNQFTVLFGNVRPRNGVDHAFGVHPVDYLICHIAGQLQREAGVPE